MSDMLRKAHAAFLRWRRANKLQCSQPRFTPGRLSRKSRLTYPTLASKAAQSKILSFWLASAASDFASREDATATDKAVNMCVWAYVQVLTMLDKFPLLLSEEQGSQLQQAGMRHLRVYSYLHRESANRQGTDVMRNCWLLQPKHHFFLSYVHGLQE